MSPSVDLVVDDGTAVRRSFAVVGDGDVSHHVTVTFGREGFEIGKLQLRSIVIGGNDISQQKNQRGRYETREYAE